MTVDEAHFHRLLNVLRPQAIIRTVFLAFMIGLAMYCHIKTVQCDDGLSYITGSTAGMETLLPTSLFFLALISWSVQFVQRHKIRTLVNMYVQQRCTVSLSSRTASWMNTELAFYIVYTLSFMYLFQLLPGLYSTDTVVADHPLMNDTSASTEMKCAALKDFKTESKQLIMQSVGVLMFFWSLLLTVLGLPLSMIGYHMEASRTAESIDHSRIREAGVQKTTHQTDRCKTVTENNTSEKLPMLTLIHATRETGTATPSSPDMTVADKQKDMQSGASHLEQTPAIRQSSLDSAG